MPRPRFSSILPPKKGIFSGPEVNSAAKFKGTCQVACFFVVVVGFPLKTESVTIGFQKGIFFMHFFVVSVFQVVCVLLLVAS